MVKSLEELAEIAGRHAKEIMDETDTIIEAMVIDTIIHDCIYTIKRKHFERQK